ncbi:MAG: DUF2442 domain-containing protein [Treponema sp.]|nr:DUF2442 domain-containing protein [Candidatus Treponema caballi]
MIPRIKSLKPLDDFQLQVLFDDGKNVIYNVREDIDSVENFKELETLYGLWKQVQLDESRTCVFWNDHIDLASDTLYEYGTPVN